MSNRIMLIPCQFVDSPKGVTTHGFRMVDDFDKTYNNMLRRALPKDDLKALESVITKYSDEKVAGFVEYMKDRQCGLFIRDTWYDWKKVKPILDKVSV